MNLLEFAEKLDNSDDNTDVAQIAAGLKAAVSLGIAKPNTYNLDWGGGRHNLGTEYMKEQGITSLVHDPFKRSAEHNESVLRAIKELKGADSVTICNVLNVIPEKEDRIKCVKDAMKYLKSRHKMLIQVYEKDRTGILIKTTRGYQMNQPLSFYKKELEEAGIKNMEQQGNYLVITK
jgi:hypothetical protein